MKETKERQRRKYAEKGTRSQKMTTFRLDNENALWLESQPNKGRYINNLIARDREASQENVEPQKDKQYDNIN